jgi:hypothetical protein
MMRWTSRLVGTLLLVALSLGLAQAATYKCKDAAGNWSEEACKAAKAAPSSGALPAARSTNGQAGSDANLPKQPPDWDPSWGGAGPKPRRECQALCYGCDGSSCSSLGDVFSMDTTKEKAYQRMVAGCDWRARTQHKMQSSQLRFRLRDEIPAEPPGFVMHPGNPLVCD